MTQLAQEAPHHAFFARTRPLFTAPRRVARTTAPAFTERPDTAGWTDTTEPTDTEPTDTERPGMAERLGASVVELANRLRQFDALLAPPTQPPRPTSLWEPTNPAPSEKATNPAPSETPKTQLTAPEKPTDPAPSETPKTQLTAPEKPTDPAPSETPRARLTSLMVEVGVPEVLAASISDAALACAAVESVPESPSEETAPASWSRANDMLSTVETVHVLSTQLDAIMISATSQMTLEIGKLLLADKRLTDPGDLSQTNRDRWRSRTKSLARHEIEAVIGWGAGEVIDLVSLANAPSAVTRPVLHALMHGEASWALARRYVRACAGLAHEDAAALATAFFGDDPQDSVTERLTSDGAWTGEPWRHKEFNRALDREVASLQARDPEAGATSRRAARERADVRVHLDDDGSAEVMIGCLTLQGAAIADRIEHAARVIRKAGDPRTLRQLRSAVATALLLHGTVDFGDLSDDPDTITLEQSAQLAKVLHGLPTADLNVIVPWTMLASAAAPTCSCHAPEALSGHTPSGPFQAVHRPSGQPPRRQPTSGQSSSRQPPSSHSPSGHSPSGRPPMDPRPASRPRPDQSLPDGAQSAPSFHDSLTASTGIAEVLGRHSAFISTPEVRELMLTPGSILHRLVTDPTTGRCLERSTTAYRFTQAQREQIIAADRFCRAPGCLHPGSQAQIDHVQAHGTPGGETRESNGQLVHEAHHDLKTKGAWKATINEEREVTWTTLLGRIYRTKAHDYRQYTRLLRSALDSVDEHAAGSAQEDPISTRTAAIDLAVHTALSYRPAEASLQSDDDWDESDRRFYGWGMISLSYGTAQGRRRYGPHPDRVATERRRHAETSSPSPDDEPAVTEGSDFGTQETALHIDPMLFEGAPRLDDPALLDGAPPAHPEDCGRYTRSVPWDTENDDPPPF